jgi:NTE family protein
VLRDQTSKRAGSTNVMDPSVVPALVAAAREQGRREARRLHAILATAGG